MGKNVVVIGTQWGDEGKGKIVDWLTEHAQGVVRFQGGHNAGHTLVIGGTQDGAAPDSVGHPAPGRRQSTSATASCCRRRRCCRRSASSRRAGVEVRSRLKISPACPLVLPYHVALDQAREGAMGDAQDRHDRPRHRPGLRGQDRAPRDPRAGPLLPATASPRSSSALLEFHNFVLTQYFKRDAGAVREDARRDAGARRRDCAPMVADVAALLQEARARGRVAAVRRRAGRAARHRPRHLSVRHVVELPRRRRGAGRGRRPAVARLRARHHQGVHDARRHRPVPDRAHRRHRRAASRSAATSSARSPAGRAAAAGSTSPALTRSLQLNGVTGLCITKLDVLDGLREIRICTGYTVHGKPRRAAAHRAPTPSPSACRSTRRCRAGARARSA